MMDISKRIAEKGCKSIEFFSNIRRLLFFYGEYVKAVRWYGELFKMTNLLSE